MVKGKKFLEKLSEYNPSPKEIAESINHFSGGDIDWIDELVYKYCKSLVDEVYSKIQKKQASPFVVLSVLSAILQAYVNDLQEFAHRVGKEELLKICKDRGISVDEVEEVYKCKRVNENSKEYIA